MKSQFRSRRLTGQALCEMFVALHCMRVMYEESISYIWTWNGLPGETGSVCVCLKNKPENDKTRLPASSRHVNDLIGFANHTLHRSVLYSVFTFNCV